MKYLLAILITLFIKLMATGLLLAGHTTARDSLKVGSTAPPLYAGKWIKGETISTFNPKYYYIIEFSGVSCAPCRASIHHLSEMAVNYKSILKVVSIYVLENGAYPPKDTINASYVQRVERFIDKMGDKIRYEVAVDNPKQSIFKDWMVSAGRPGIPAAFIVDRAGMIKWIGHPKDLEAQLLEMDPAFTRLASAAGHTLQSATDTVPPLQKFRSLLSGHELDAYAFAKQMSVGPLKDNEPILYYMARDIVNRSPTLKKPDLDLAISLVERAVFLCVDDILKARMMSLKSEIFQRMGNRQAAQMALINARSQLEPFQKEIKYTAEINKINKKLERYSN